MQRYFGFVGCFLLSTSVLLSSLPADHSRAWHEDPDVVQRLSWKRAHELLPDGHPATAARAAALRQLHDMQRGSKRNAGARQLSSAQLATTLSNTSWTPVPAQTANWFGSTTAGRMTSVVADSVNGNVVYAGAADGGVWKSTDAGAHWTPLTDDQDSLAIGALAIDPVNPNVIYAGTSEAYDGIGLLKSTDAGQTWSLLPAPFASNPNSDQPWNGVYSIAIGPTTGTLLVSGFGNDQTALYRSTDRGATWAMVLSKSNVPIEKVLYASDGSAAYAVVGDGGGTNGPTAPFGIYKSTDDGASWSQILPLGVNGVYLSTVEFALAPSAPRTLYVALRQYTASIASPVTYTYSVLKSTDAGATWQTLPTPPDWCGDSACTYTHVIGVSPVDPNVVFLGGFVIFRSLDGGQTWGRAMSVPHVDLHALAFSRSGTVYLAGDGGISTLQSPAANTQTWTAANTGLATLQFYTVDVAPNPNDFLIGGTQDDGTLIYDASKTATAPPQWDYKTCGDGGHVAIDPGNPANLYASCMENQLPAFEFSHDGGTTWTAVEQHWVTSYFVNPSAPIALDPANPAVIYSGGLSVMRSTDAGGSWTAISPQFNSSLITQAAVAPSDSNTVYVATWDEGLRVTHNSSSASPTWTGLRQAVPTRLATQIAVDPHDPETAYFTYAGFYQANVIDDRPGHVFVTHDALASVTDITANLPNIPVNGIVIDPDQLGTLYVATDIGVFVSTDNGGTWTPMITGLPRSAVTALNLRRSTRTLFAATYGRSVWEMQLPAAQILLPTITPASLTFASQTVGSTSAPQPVTVANQTAGAIAITRIDISGDFSQTNDCPSSLAVGQQCHISVTFSPAAAGTRTGMLTLSSSAAQQQVGLSGTTAAGAAAADFTITASATAATVSAAAPAHVRFTLTALNGFSAAIALACSAPSSASVSFTCTFSPASPVVSGSQPVDLTVAVAQPSRSSTAVSIAAALAPFVFGLVFVGPERRKFKLLLLILGATIVCAVLIGCGATAQSPPTTAPAMGAGPGASGGGSPNGGSGGNSGGGSNGGGNTSPVTFPLAITATSGTLQHSVAVNVTVQ